MAQRAHHVSGRDGPPLVMPHIKYHVSWLMDTISFSQTPNACPPGNARMQESHPPAPHALTHPGATRSTSSNNVLKLKISSPLFHLQRIPRYELLLKEYIQRLPDNSPDTQDSQSEYLHRGKHDESASHVFNRLRHAAFQQRRLWMG